MASMVYFLVFSGFLIAVTQSITTESPNEWDVERSSLNPLSYTDEAHYTRDGATVNPTLKVSQRRMTCPAGEHFTHCDAKCEVTCNNYKKPIPCFPKPCTRGCLCNLGLVRGPDKKCIEPRKCPKKQRAEAQQNLLTDVKDAQPEETGNSPFSQKEITSASETNQFPIPFICGKKETFSICPSTCPDDCDNFRDKDRKCMKICLPIPSCVCTSGYVRSPDGKCIKPHECLMRLYPHEEKNFCPRGEEYSPCHSHCEGNCRTGEENENCQSGRMLCVSGCTCKAGLVRGPDGTCIYRTECPTTPPKEPTTKVCPENEVYEDCKAACQRNCSNVHSVLPCARMCQSGCICKESMIRGIYGKCVDADECPKDSYSSDSYVTLNPAPFKVDDSYISESVTEIPSISETENSLFEELLPLSHSKPSHNCPPRHRWVPCGGHCQRNCSNKDEKDLRCRPVCIPGCICEEGLVKGPDDQCIEKDKCSKTSDSEEDSYVTLNPPPYTDDDYHIPESVTEILPTSETENSQSEEIPPASHSNQIFCGKDEIRELCPSICPDNCKNYKDTKRKCLRICLPLCVCKKGFVRGPKGKCIKPTECPGENNETCRKDEMFSQCQGNCEKNCTNWAFDLNCPNTCVSGCVCRPGRIRGPDRKCIIWSECPRSSSGYPVTTSIEDSPRIKSTVSENNRLTVSENAGCPNDHECSLSCRYYGHRYGHCNGRNRLVCSCYIENDENVEQEIVSASDNPCPNDNTCRMLCRRVTKINIGRCTGPNNMTCDCFE